MGSSLLPADRVVVPCGTGNYLLALMLLARYWHKRQVESLDWLLRGLGNRRWSPEPVSYCHKCKTGEARHTLLGARLCNACLNEFIEAKTREVAP